MDSRSTYEKRISRVLSYIDQHLGTDLGLEELAAIAHFSPWHFHRLFAALVGETLADHVRRRRIETAARQLISGRRKISDIAQETGFSSQEVLSRNFRRHFGVSPSRWRQGCWQAWADGQRGKLSKIHQNDRKKHQDLILRLGHHGVAIPFKQPTSGVPSMKVEIKTLAPVRVAYLRHVGPYGESGVTAAWQRFAAWCESRELMQPRRKMFGVSQDSPDITAPEQCRYDCCVEFDGNTTGAADIGVQTLAGGLYGCADFSGTALEIYAAWHWLCSEWLPDSGFEPDERPWFEMYPEDFAQDPVTGRFSCFLCLPIRPLTGS